MLRTLGPGHQQADLGNCPTLCTGSCGINNVSVTYSFKQYSLRVRDPNEIDIRDSFDIHGPCSNGNDTIEV